jgi:hypothetical protein
MACIGRTELAHAGMRVFRPAGVAAISSLVAIGPSLRSSVAKRIANARVG